MIPQKYNNGRFSLLSKASKSKFDQNQWALSGIKNKNSVVLTSLKLHMNYYNFKINNLLEILKLTQNIKI